MPEKAMLTVGDTTIELPIVEGTEGERAIDITQLREQTGLITYDPSLGNTASVQERDHVHRRREGDPPLPGHPHRAVHRQAQLRRGRLAADLRAAAERATNWQQFSEQLTDERTAARRRSSTSSSTSRSTRRRWRSSRPR